MVEDIPDESSLRSRLGLIDEGSTEARTLLTDLANLKLSQGEVEQAQELFQKLLLLRRDELRDECAADACDSAGAASQPEPLQPALPSTSTSQAASAVAPSHPAAAAHSSHPAAAASGPCEKAAAASPAVAACSNSGQADDEDEDDGWESTWADGLQELQPVAERKAEVSEPAVGASRSGRGGGGASSSGQPSGAVAKQIPTTTVSQSIASKTTTSSGSDRPSAAIASTGRPTAAAATTAAAGGSGSGPRSSSGASPSRPSVNGAQRGADGPEGDDQAVARGPTTTEHILEAYDLDPSSRAASSSGLVAFIAARCIDAVKPEVRVVDDRHALIVCPTNRVASQLLDLEDHVFHFRPFAEASSASRNWAPVELLPPCARPKTTAAVAKRLLSHALGLPGLRDKQAEAQLAQQRRGAKEDHRARLVAKEAVWGDDDG